MSTKVIAINQKRPEQALEHLCRLTGLNFHSLPESLVNQPENGMHQTSASTRDADETTLKLTQQQVG